ncbi:MAG: hypothetical protein Q4C49_02720 [Bacillota bacterium]|nr:hypothetical protein [Bacillota bacterium]
MAKEKNSDELMELLDSFDIDEDYTALSNKMDAFTKEKNKRKQNKQEDVSFVQPEEDKKAPESISNTIIAPLKPDTIGDAGGKTLIFPGTTTTTTNNNKAGGETVVINDPQSHQFFKGNEDPDEILRRQVIEEFNGQPVLSKRVKQILFIIAGGIVVFVLLLGGIKMISSFANTEKVEEEVDQEKIQYYNEIRSWAQSFQTLDESQKTRIKSLESKFNKLSEEQKEEINTILRQKTGKTFDELLAEAKSEKTEDKKNNNTELAEKKAQLKSRIQEAKAAVDAAQEKMNDAQQALTQAEEDYNEAQELRDAGSTEAEAALAVLNEIEKDALLPADEFKEKYETNEAWASAKNEAKAYWQQKVGELNSLEINLNNAYYAYNVATESYNSSKAEYDNCVNVYNDLVNQYNALDKE